MAEKAHGTLARGRQDSIDSNDALAMLVKINGGEAATLFNALNALNQAETNAAEASQEWLRSIGGPDQFVTANLFEKEQAKRDMAVAGAVEAWRKILKRRSS